MRESGEDYLETIYILAQKKKGVHAIDVATALGYSKPSVTRALRILKESGFITVDEDNHIKLTSSGDLRAKQIYERHQIITKFWIMHGVSEQNALKDACRMEHDISEETFECIKNIVYSKK